MEEFGEGREAPAGRRLHGEDGVSECGSLCGVAPGVAWVLLPHRSLRQEKAKCY